MPILIPYLLKLSIGLGLVCLFYQLVLRRLTFYGANRWYLILGSLLCFLAPLINISVLVQDHPGAGGLIRYIPAVQTYSAGLEEATVCPAPLWSASWTKWDWILLALALGGALLFLRLVLRCLSFFRLRRRATLVSDEGLKIYQVDAAIIPFSFGNAIFINSAQHTEAELQEIIRHEFIHVKQRHTLDILWAELLCILNWYNPAAWILKSAIRQNLEFIADHQVLENGINKKHYQYLLLKVIGNDQFSIAHKFNFSSLKKRIAMMNKTKSARVHLLRFLFLLPLLAVILISFREQIGDRLRQEPVTPGQMPGYRDTIPEVTRPNKKGYIINIRDKAGTCIVEVKDKNGKEVARLPLTQWNDEASAYEEKYGEIPPPPPPAAPDAPALPVNPPSAPHPPKPTGILSPELPALPPAPPAPVAMPEHVKRIQVTNNKAIVWLKNGEKKQYDLSDPRQKTEFEKEFGKMPETPPIPATPAHGSAAPAIAPDVPVAAADHILSYEAQPALSGDPDILVIISKYTNRQQLENFIGQMKEKGYELRFDESIYNDKGILVTLKGSIRSKDGGSNFSANEFEKLRLASYKKDGRTYFKVSVSDKTEVIRVSPLRPSILPYPYDLGKKKDNC